MEYVQFRVVLHPIIINPTRYFLCITPNKRLVRIDELYEHGVAKVCRAFLADSTHRVYGDQAAMLGLFEPKAELGYTNKGDDSDKMALAALWHVSCWHERAYAVSALAGGKNVQFECLFFGGDEGDGGLGEVLGILGWAEVSWDRSSFKKTISK